MNRDDASNRIGRTLHMGAAALLLAAVLLGTYAQAGDRGVRQTTVRYAELDLSKPAGAKVLYRRLENAATRVCGGRTTVYAPRAYRKCYHTALSDAIIQVNSPLLSEMHGVQMERVAAKK